MAYNKNMKKIITIFSLVSLLVIGIRPATSHALTREEIMAQIQLLLQQVAFLQAEIQRLNNGNTNTCSNIYSTLSLGSSGSEVGSLQNILTKEGFYIPSNETSSMYFGSGTRSAVISFQEKYRYETLTPSGLFFGTGIVGPYTRSKLNQICGTGTGTGGSSGSLLVLFPNGGETWQAGESKKIWWEYKNNNDYSYAGSKIELWKGSQVVATVYSSGASTDLPIPSNAPSGSDYKIKISSVSNPNVYDWSDSYLSIYGGGTNLSNFFTYPLGGEQIAAGEIMRVRWDYSYSQSFRVELYKGSQFILSVGDNGFSGADILMPSNLAAGSDYKVRVYSVATGKTYESSYFTVWRNTY